MEIEDTNAKVDRCLAVPSPPPYKEHSSPVTLALTLLSSAQHSSLNIATHLFLKMCQLPSQEYKLGKRVFYEALSPQCQDKTRHVEGT